MCPAGKCTGLTDMSKDRRGALRRRMVHAATSAPIFRSSEDLTSRLSKYDGGNVQDLPVVVHLCMGIVCVDISRCSSTPKSLTDALVSSGKSWTFPPSYFGNRDVRSSSLLNIGAEAAS